MAKKPKGPETQEFPPPLNMSDDMDDLTVITSGCMSVQDSPLFGTFTVLTRVGHYDFIINEAAANEMVQKLREFLRGDSTNMLEDE